MSNHSREVKNQLTNARELAKELGLKKGSKPNGARGILVCCPEHSESEPSCSIRTAADGTLQVKCYGCGWTGDALTLIASVYDLNLSSDFREVLAIGAELAGDLQLVEDIRDGHSTPGREPRKITQPAPEQQRDYPPVADVHEYWDALAPLSGVSIAPASAYLLSRAIDPLRVAEMHLARCIAGALARPRWTYTRRGYWADTGMLIVLPVVDSTGEIRSLRAWQCEGQDGPKRLPANGKSAGLLLANRLAIELLRGNYDGAEILITEGEPDYLTVATRHPGSCVFGFLNGGWTSDFAGKIPDGARVAILTHLDVDKPKAERAGERYAKQIIESIGDRCELWRMCQLQSSSH